MEKYTGKSIFKGIAIGKILFYQKGEQPVKRVKIEDTAEQIKRYEDARAKAAEQLQGLYEQALNEVGEANAAVFEVHQMMLEDDDYIDSVVNIIETPAAVMISDLLAEEVDFFSIGTNDLTQYTLAIDRQNSKLDNIYDSHHPAVLRMIQKTIENGHKAGCWVGICGELGADLTLTETFLKMGIDELSVSPTFVLPIRKLIREMSTK